MKQINVYRRKRKRKSSQRKKQNYERVRDRCRQHFFHRFCRLLGKQLRQPAKKALKTPAITLLPSATQPTTSKKRTSKSKSDAGASSTIGAGFLQSVKKATNSSFVAAAQTAHSLLKPIVGGSHEEFSPIEAADPRSASKVLAKKSSAAKVAKTPKSSGSAMKEKLTKKFEENKSPLSRAMKRLEDTNAPPLKRRASMELPIPTSALKKTPPSTVTTKRRKSRVWGNDDSNIAAAKTVAVALATSEPSPKKDIDAKTKDEDAPEKKKRGRKPKAKSAAKTVPVKKTTITKRPKAAASAKKPKATIKAAKKPKAATAKKSAATPVKATRRSSRLRK
mmetsp:Transcript_1691/g.5171  ORF Transcript_1691/g.5171 Transcript_1691/m.5171 type:complete len:335 (-) Transcript_1691:87-1091(-)